jgi:hypothetical protein
MPSIKPVRKIGQRYMRTVSDYEHIVEVISYKQDKIIQLFGNKADKLVHIGQIRECYLASDPNWVYMEGQDRPNDI